MTADTSAEALATRIIELWEYAPKNVKALEYAEDKIIRAIKARDAERDKGKQRDVEGWNTDGTPPEWMLGQSRPLVFETRDGEFGEFIELRIGHFNCRTGYFHESGIKKSFRETVTKWFILPFENTSAAGSVPEGYWKREILYVKTDASMVPLPEGVISYRGESYRKENEGFVMVPVEPTRAMTMNACDMLDASYFGYAGKVCADIYKAMIAAFENNKGQ